MDIARLRMADTWQIRLGVAILPLSFSAAGIVLLAVPPREWSLAITLFTWAAGLSVYIALGHRFRLRSRMTGTVFQSNRTWATLLYVRYRIAGAIVVAFAISGISLWAPSCKPWALLAGCFIALVGTAVIARAAYQSIRKWTRRSNPAKMACLAGFGGTFLAVTVTPHLWLAVAVIFFGIAIYATGTAYHQTAIKR
jgi:hypothetical protein